VSRIRETRVAFFLPPTLVLTPRYRNIAAGLCISTRHGRRTARDRFYSEWRMSSSYTASTPGACRTRGRWISVSTFIATCTLFIAATTAAPAHSQTCRSVGQTRLPSPDGTRELLLYARVCGERATGEIEIAPKGAPVPDRPGNIDVPGRPIQVSAGWRSNDAVFIGIPRTGPLPKPLRVDGVAITFVRLPDDR